MHDIAIVVHGVSTVIKHDTTLLFYHKRQASIYTLTLAATSHALCQIYHVKLRKGHENRDRQL